MMDDNDRIAQDDELFVLQSIYDEKYFSVEDSNPPCGRFSAHVQLPDPFYIRLKTNNAPSSAELHSDSNCSKTDFEEFVVHYLPSINLYFEFPVNYPSDSPPAFFLSCSWLSYEQLSRLCKHLDDLWNESCGEVVLFRWVQFLIEETLSFLNINDCLDITELSKFNLKADISNSVPLDVQFNNEVVISDTNTSDTSDDQCTAASGKIFSKTCMRTVKPSIAGGDGSRDCRAFLDIADGKILKTVLRDYNETKKAEDFQHAWHLCNVCFMNKLGSEFVTFKACQHFFCRECIKSYFELMISEGSVQSLNCPYEKCSTQADGTLVKQVVSKANFERYDSLLLSRTLDTMTDIAYCPRKACQCALLIDISERMGSCPACKFVFCPFCKMAYHGIAPCKFKPGLKQQICNEYLQGDSFKKAEMENRHGKRTIRSLVEEVLSEKWIGSNSKPCPRCNASIEKTAGCNKMTCFSCGTFFCWLCTKQLKASNPYSHYSDKSAECYNKLFPEDYVDEEFIVEEEYMFEPGEFLNF